MPLNSDSCVLNADEEAQLTDVLVFWSGASTISSLGFDCDPSLHFSETDVYPTASTCTVSLVLPTRYYDNYAEFKGKCIFAFLNHGGFGLQ